MRLKKLLAIGLFAAFSAVSPGHAADGFHFGGDSGTQFYAGGQADVSEGASTVFATGGEVNVESKDIGKLIAAGGRVSVQDIRANEVTAAGGHVTVDGVVNKSVTLAGGQIEITPQTKVGGDVVVAGGNVTIGGDVGGDVIVASGNIALSGHVKGDVRLRGGKIAIAPGTQIDGDLNYRSDEELQLPSDIRVGGSVNREGAGKHGYRFWEHLGVVLLGFATLASIGFIVMLFVFAFLMLLLFGTLLGRVNDTMDFAPVKSFGVGLLVTLAMPMVFVVLLITIIGIPLALLCLAVFPIIYGLGVVAAAHWIGLRLRRAMRPAATDMGFGRRVLWTFVGVVVFVLVGVVPFVGNLVQFVVATMGLGGLGVTMTRA